MDGEVYLRSILALVAVLGLIAMAAWVVRRFGVGGALPLGRRARRLAVVEILPLDNRRRVVLVRKDSVEHLLLVGGTSDIVVEKGWSSLETDPALPLEQEEDR